MQTQLTLSFDLRQCSLCHQIKPVLEFARDASRKSGYSWRCALYERLRSQKRRLTTEGKLSRTEQHRRRKRRGVAWLDEYRMTHPCVVCGETEIACLDLHHLDPSQKTKDVSRLAYDAYSKEIMEAEAKKCVVLCANCHRKVHAGIVTIKEESA